VINLSAIKVEEKPKFWHVLLSKDSEGNLYGKGERDFDGEQAVRISYSKKPSERFGCIKVSVNQKHNWLDATAAEFGSAKGFQLKAVFRQDQKGEWKFEKFEQPTDPSVKKVVSTEQLEKDVEELFKNKTVVNWFEDIRVRPKFEHIELERYADCWSFREEPNFYGGVSEVQITYKRNAAEKSGRIHAQTYFSENVGGFEVSSLAIDVTFKRDGQGEWKVEKLLRDRELVENTDEKREYEKHLEEFLTHRDARKWLGEVEEKCRKTEEFQKHRQS
jgi:hypothetical protein